MRFLGVTVPPAAAYLGAKQHSLQRQLLWTTRPSASRPLPGRRVGWTTVAGVRGGTHPGSAGRTTLRWLQDTVFLDGATVKLAAAILETKPRWLSPGQPPTIRQAALDIAGQAGREQHISSAAGSDSPEHRISRRDALRKPRWASWSLHMPRRGRGGSPAAPGPIHAAPPCSPGAPWILPVGRMTQPHRRAAELAYPCFLLPTRDERPEVRRGDEGYSGQRRAP